MSIKQFDRSHVLYVIFVVHLKNGKCKSMVSVSSMGQLTTVWCVSLFLRKQGIIFVFDCAQLLCWVNIGLNIFHTKSATTRHRLEEG